MNSANTNLLGKKYITETGSILELVEDHGTSVTFAVGEPDPKGRRNRRNITTRYFSELVRDGEWKEK